MRKEAGTIPASAKETSIRLPGTSFALAILIVLCFAPALAAQTRTTHQLSGYQVLAIEPFAVDKNAATENFPNGLEKLMHSTALRKVREKRLFASVIDSAELTAQPAAAQRAVILSGTVILFDKGSQAARFWGGFGAGASKVKVRFVMRDAATGAEVMRFDQEGKFYGMWSTFGGSDDEALIKAATSVVKNLIKTLEQNR